MTRRMAFVTIALVFLVARPDLARAEAFDFDEEVRKGSQRPGFTLQQMVKTPLYTVGALAVKDEIKMHRHNDGNHILYIVSGHGTATIDGKVFQLKSGTVVHIPRGMVHSVKAKGSDLQLVDFAHPPFDPAKMEWIK